jgi:hypothetical protein
MTVKIRGGQIQNASISSTQLATDSVGSDQIAANAVNSAEIASNAITSAKLASGVINSASLLANTVVTAAKIDLTGTFDFSSGTLQSGTPSNASDVANKQYVDGIVGGGVYWKEPARVGSTANVTISNPGTDTFDGVQISSNNRILLKNQTATAENGVYDFNGSSSALTRSSDANSADELNGLAIFVKEGTTNADQGFVQTSEVSSLGTSPVQFAQFTGLGQIEAGSGLTKTANRLDVSVGAGIEIVSDEVRVKLGAGVDAFGGDLNVAVDDSSLEINGSNELQIKANGITSSMIGSNQVTGSEIAALTVGTANLADSSVSTAKLGGSAVTEAKLASLSVSEAKLQSSSVTASKIASAVAGDGLAYDSSTGLAVNVDDAGIEINADSLRLKDLGITSAKLQSNSVITAKIADANVTEAKLSSSVAGSGLLGGAGTALSVNTGAGLQIDGDAVKFRPGAGLDFNVNDVDIKVDDSSIEIDAGGNNLRVKALGIGTGKIQSSACTTDKLADNSVTAVKVGFLAYQELTTISGGSTVNIDLAREVDSAFANGIMAYKNGLAMMNQTALGGSAANNDDFTISVVGGVTRLSFGASLTDGDDVLITYMT